MLKKRGQWSITKELLFEVILAVAITLIIFWYTYETVKPIGLHKEFLVRDIGLVTDIVQSAPFPYYLNYTPREINMTKYNMSWNKSNFWAEYGLRKDKLPRRFIFLRNTNIFKKDVSVNANPNIFFYNTRGTLRILEEERPFTITQKCEPLEKNFKKVFLDPGHGEKEDTGITINEKVNRRPFEIVESRSMCKIANLITDLDTIEFFSSRLYDGGSIDCTSFRKKEIQEDLNQAELVLSFHFADYETEKEIIKAYVEYNDGFGEANTIACNILNKIEEEFGYDTIIIPVDLESFDLTDQFPLMGKKNIPNIAFEFGSVKRHDIRETMVDPSRIAKMSNIFREVLDET